MRKLCLYLLFLLIPMGLLAEEISTESATNPVKKVRMEKCEPSIMIQVGGGPTGLDDVWRAEFALDVAMGVQFRNGHAVYAGVAMEELQREATYTDARVARTSLPVYLQYQWRCFGWHKNCEDKYRWSPFLGLKAGWNFLQDVHTAESTEGENLDDLKNQEFVTPQIGIDVRCMNYMSIGLIVECEISRRYVGDDGGKWCKPRAALLFKF